MGYVEPSKEDVEAFIIEKKPVFDDINFDPEILMQKIQKDLTWMEVAKERGTSSTALQTELSKYRKRVAELMKEVNAMKLGEELVLLVDGRAVIMQLAEVADLDRIHRGMICMD
ncbi:hypothetical protein [Paenibacillus agricola]|nr:hypothetical protein [Paenibacillus agricola]